jgi:hypothetical protein
LNPLLVQLHADPGLTTSQLHFAKRHELPPKENYKTGFRSTMASTQHPLFKSMAWFRLHTKEYQKPLKTLRLKDQGILDLLGFATLDHAIFPVFRHYGWKVNLEITS